MSSRGYGLREAAARLLFRGALPAFPADFRAAHGEEMLDAFSDALHARADSAMLGYAIRSSWDALRAGWSVRWRRRERPQHGRPKVSTLWQDVRYAARTLIKNPAFTAVAVLTLGLGIGANAAIFGVIDAVLLQPLPFREPERLVQVLETRMERGWDRASVTHANFWDLHDQNKTFDGLGALRFGSINLTGREYPERLSLGSVTADFFRVLGVDPVAGRTFAAGEDQPGANARVAVLSHLLWTRAFGADPALVGRTITLDGQAHTVIGVLPAGEPWLDAADVFVPLVRTADPNRGSFELAVVGRLAKGVSFQAALADLTLVAQRLAQQYPKDDAGMGIRMDPSSAWGASDGIRRALWILLGAVGFLLLIACVNLANLVLAKATGRTRERALRAALGASRSRLVRQALTESLLLSGLGALVGLGMAFGVVTLLKSLDPGQIPRLAQVGVDLNVLGFTAAAAVVTGLLTGILPAIHAGQGELAATLRDGERSQGHGRSMGRARGLLVAVEVAASLALLVGAGLLLRSFGQLLSVDRGFETENRVLAGVSLPESYTNERANQFIQHFIQRVSGSPGIVAVAAVSMRPLEGVGTGMAIFGADKPTPAPDAVPWASWRVITAGYFRTMGVPIVRGRDFTEQDIIAKPWRVIISQRLADRLWPGEDAVGRTAHLWQGQSNLPAEVIGVAGDMRDWGLDDTPSLAVYLPYYGAGASTLYFVIQGNNAPGSLRPLLRGVLAEFDSGLPLARVESMGQLVGDSLAARRFIMILLAAFAGVALLLALAGIYGVLSYSVSRRTGEIGVRLALGASPGKVLRLIVAQGMKPVVLGLLVGIGSALALTRLMASLLFGITATDVATYAGVAGLLVGAALLSCYLPARQALRVDVVAALRKE
jgi:putative ABC transport system permease protein